VIGSYELFVATLGVVLSLGTVGVCLYRRSFLRYFFLNAYLLSSVVFMVVLYYVYRTEGYDSPSYFYAYYVGDGLFNVFGYLLIASFFDRLLRESVFHKYIRPTLLLSFLLVVGVSGRFISSNVDRLASRFVYEFQQNMFFVGVLLTFLLWISINYLHAESRRFVLLVSGLGIYFSAHAANYALQYLVPALGPILTKIPPLAYNLMALLWLYTFWRVAEDEVAVLEAPGEAVVLASAGRK